MYGQNFIIISQNETQVCKNEMKKFFIIDSRGPPKTCISAKNGPFDDKVCLFSSFSAKFVLMCHVWC